CLETRLIVELDGGQHSSQTISDAERSAWLETQGFRVLRFWNHEVLQNIEAVKERIREALPPPHPNLPPPGGKEETVRPRGVLPKRGTCLETTARRKGRHVKH